MKRLSKTMFHCPWNQGREEPERQDSRGITEKDGAASEVEASPEPTDDRTPAANPAALLADLAGLPAMFITAGAYRDTLDFLTHPDHGICEAGGMLVGPKDHAELITHFIPDRDAQTTAASYSPNVAWLNATLKQFLACGMDAKGLAHRHPSGCSRPSYGDLLHVHSTFGRAKNSGARQFFLPIVCDGRLYPYLVTRDEPERVQIATLIII
jgi:hypothetical protein